MIQAPGDYPRVDHLKGASFGYASALLANIRLGGKGLAGTNKKVYRIGFSSQFPSLFPNCEMSWSMPQKSCPGANFIKKFCP
jgi:hypothetical protein